MGGAQVILSTAPSSKALSAVFDGLARRGKLLVVGAAREPLPIIPATLLSGRSITGWPSGIPSDAEDTMNFCTLTGIRPMVETFRLADAAKAYERMLANKVRFRAVLTIGT